MAGGASGWEETVAGGVADHPGYLNSANFLAGGGGIAQSPYNLPSFIFGIPADFGEGGGAGIMGTDIIVPSSIDQYHHKNRTTPGLAGTDDEAPQPYMADSFPPFSPNTYPGYSVAHKDGEIVGYTINVATIWSTIVSINSCSAIPTTLSNVMFVLRLEHLLAHYYQEQLLQLLYHISKWDSK